MLQTVRAEKLDENIGVICLVSMFPITYVHLKVLITLFQKMLWFIGVWATVHEILVIKISKKMLTQQKFLKNSSTSNTHTSETVSHSIINNTSSWKCVTRPIRCLYVNCFNRLRFLTEVSTKLQKTHFLDNLRTATQEGSMETRQMTPFFYLLFPTYNVHFWIWKCSKFIFMWSPVWFILVCKIPQFLAESYRFRQLITLF